MHCGEVMRMFHMQNSGMCVQCKVPRCELMSPPAAQLQLLPLLAGSTTVAGVHWLAVKVQMKLKVQVPVRLHVRILLKVWVQVQ